MTSPGYITGIPGGYGAIISALTFPTESLKLVRVDFAKNAFLGVIAIGGMGGSENSLIFPEFTVAAVSFTAFIKRSASS